MLFDPALLLGFQAAMAPPRITPPAIERAWRSPLADESARASDRIIADSIRDTDAWRARVAEFRANLAEARANEWDWTETELADFDKAIAQCEAQIESNHRHLKQGLRRAEKISRKLARVDPSLVSVFRSYFDQTAYMQRENLALLENVLKELRSLRAANDVRSGAMPSYVHKPWTPNAETVAAMRRARTEELEVVSLEDLRAAILADD